MAFGNEEKTQLANDIIGGDRHTSKPNIAKSTEGGEQFDGERTGDIRIEDADNGFIVRHERRIARRASKSPKGDTDAPGLASNGPSYDHINHQRVFGSDDHQGMLNHITNVMKSPKSKGSRY